MNNKEITALLKNIADNFKALSDIYSSSIEEKTKEVSADEKATSYTKKKETTTYSKEDVRAKLSQKAKLDDCKYKSEVKAIVAKYSSDGTLTKVPEEKYPELMADLEVIGNV